MPSTPPTLGPVLTPVRNPVPAAFAALLALCLGLALGSCEAAAPDGRSALEGLPEATLTETLRLGGPDAPEPEAFDVPPPLAVDSEGRLHALHRARSQVAVFDSDGAFVHWVAGSGTGPGEFTLPSRMGMVGDTLWVGDFITQRISRFAPDGSHASTRTAPWSYGVPMSAPQTETGYLEGGRVWVEPSGRPVSIEGRIELPVLVGPPGLGRADTLFRIPMPRGWLHGMAWGAFAEPPFHAVAPDGSGILVADWSPESPGRVGLRFFDSEGRVAREQSIDLPGRAMAPDLRARAIDEGIERVEALAGRMREQGVPEAEIPRPDRSTTESQLYLPDHVPPVRDVRVGLDGSWWIELVEDMEAGPWLAIDSEGMPRFTVRLPDDATLRVASLDRVWAVTTDDLDIPAVVRWELAVPPTPRRRR